MKEKKHYTQNGEMMNTRSKGKGKRQKYGREKSKEKEKLHTQNMQIIKTWSKREGTQKEEI